MKKRIAFWSECLLILLSLLFIYSSHEIQKKVSSQKYWSEEVRRLKNEIELEKWKVLSLEVELEKIELEKRAYLSKISEFYILPFSKKELQEKYEKKIKNLQNSLSFQKFLLSQNTKKLKQAEVSLSLEENKKASLLQEAQ